jgi:hypothetical protein
MNGKRAHAPLRGFVPSLFQACPAFNLQPAMVDRRL